MHVVNQKIIELFASPEARAYRDGSALKIATIALLHIDGLERNVMRDMTSLTRHNFSNGLMQLKDHEAISLERKKTSDSRYTVVLPTQALGFSVLRSTDITPFRAIVEMAQTLVDPSVDNTFVSTELHKLVEPEPSIFHP